MDIKSRLRNKALWVSIAALILLLAKALGFQVNEGQYNQIVDLILAILVGAGILYNPTTQNTGLRDDE
jgi:phi LC3 family holin